MKMRPADHTLRYGEGSQHVWTRCLAWQQEAAFTRFEERYKG
jgi:hypothetical protein